MRKIVENFTRPKWRRRKRRREQQPEYQRQLPSARPHLRPITLAKSADDFNARFRTMLND